MNDNEYAFKKYVLRKAAMPNKLKRKIEEEIREYEEEQNEL